MPKSSAAAQRPTSSNTGTPLPASGATEGSAAPFSPFLLAGLFARGNYSPHMGRMEGIDMNASETPNPGSARPLFLGNADRNVDPAVSYANFLGSIGNSKSSISRDIAASKNSVLSILHVVSICLSEASKLATVVARISLFGR